MYDLNHNIKTYNLLNRSNIKSNKNWGLFYLERTNLDFLNQRSQLIRNNDPLPFLRKSPPAPAKKRYQSLRLGNSPRQNRMARLVTKDSPRRLEWEANLSTTLIDQAWKEIDDKKNTNIIYKKYFDRIYKDWNIHKSFQRYSIEDLLVLIQIIAESQYHFNQAKEELQRKKFYWISFQRIPDDIAKNYKFFLENELALLSSLRNQILQALLLHLRSVEKQGLVMLDDVSYTLALECANLGFIVPKFPGYRSILSRSAFNNAHRAVEEYGNEDHKKQLYQLTWYKAESKNDIDALKTINVSNFRLLIPKNLFGSVLKEQKKWFWLLVTYDSFYQFLEQNQALFAQLSIKVNHGTSMLRQIPPSYAALVTLVAQYRLLQQSRYILNHSTLKWWQWQKKYWNKIFDKWLVHERDTKQVILLVTLRENLEELKKNSFIFQDPEFQDLTKMILPTVESLINKDVNQEDKASLVEMINLLKINSVPKKVDSGVKQNSKHLGVFDPKLHPDIKKIGSKTPIWKSMGAWFGFSKVNGENVREIIMQNNAITNKPINLAPTLG